MKLLIRLSLAASVGLALAAGACTQGSAVPSSGPAPATGLGAGRGDAPAAPKVDSLPLKDSVSQYGITWTFEKPAHVGQFVNGDYYVVGPAVVASVTPAPAGAGTEFHNGSMLNPPMVSTMGYDARDKAYYDAKLTAKFPQAMKPGDSLVSTIGYEEKKARPHVMTGHNDNEKSGGWIQTAAVLTCLEQPVPADTFRPSYAGHQPKLYRFSDLHLDLLPSVRATEDVGPLLTLYGRVFERPWIDHVYNWGSRVVHPTENMPDYGREIARGVGEASLLVMTDVPMEKRKKVLVGLVQYGIDLWGIVQNGGKGWPAQGGFGNGRKWPIVMAGVLFQDQEMQSPKAEFDEDQHIAFGKSWTGAKVLFTGQYPTIGDKQPDRGAYEHLTPDKWPGPNKTMSEGYRRCCTSHSYVGEALAARLMHAEKAWNYDAFFAYVDRWMTEDDTEHLKVIKEALNADMSRPFERQGQTWDPFVQAMWAKYRDSIPPSADGSKTPSAATTWK
jgi:hypothetical protein